MMGRWGAIRPPCADNPALMDMTHAPLAQVLEATRACRSCPLRGPCSDQPYFGDDQMQAGVIHHRARSGRIRAYTATEWIKFRKLMPLLAAPPPKPEAVMKRASRKDGRKNRARLACHKGHDWPENPQRNAAGRRICEACKGSLKCGKGHALTPATLAVDKHGNSYCRTCKEAHAAQIRGRGFSARKVRHRVPAEAATLADQVSA